MGSNSQLPSSALISIGDELLIGQIINSNATWLGDKLDVAGYPVREMVTIGDAVGDIHSTLDRLRHRHDLIVITGGLGPTHDDITRDAIGSFYARPLRRDEAVMAELKSYFAERSREMTAGAEKMAEVPADFVVLQNSVGTAPGLWFNDKEAGCIVCLLPGVPREMKAIVEERFLPRLTGSSGSTHVRHRTLLAAGAGESVISNSLEPINDLLPHGVKLAFLPSALLGVRLRITATDSLPDESAGLIDETDRRIREKIGHLIYGIDDDTLEEVVGNLLIAGERTVGIAESCTGGLISNRFTDTPGSSAYLLGCAVTYSNASKHTVLGIDSRLIATYGAVSEVVVREMAEGARKLFGATDGLASTGIAGPGGGTPEKPVGTVWIAHASSSGTVSRQLSLTKDRIVNKELTSTLAINLLRNDLLGETNQHPF